jgi:hypothetical protein
MKFASFQPYFFPYLGHFDLINKVDKWIVSDSLQFINGGWINRNRILHPHSGWCYITVPLKSHHHDILIKDVEIDNTQNWREQIFGQISHYRRQAPFYFEVLKLVELCLSYETNSISKLDTSILSIICKKLGISFDYLLRSEMTENSEKFTSRVDALCAMAKELGAKEFINPAGGAHLYDAERFNSLGVKLSFQCYTNLVYATGGYTYEPALSIIDVMMWNSCAEIQRYLQHS